MHGDLIECIAERVLAGDVADYVRFRSVCRSWRSCTVGPRGVGLSDVRFHPRRWMMFPEGHGLYPGHAKLRGRGRVRFFCGDTGAFVTVHLPIFKDHAELDNPDGLLLLQRDADTAVVLLNPFTGDVAELPQLYQHTPPQPRLSDEANLPYFRRVCAAVSVSPVTGTITVLVALENVCPRPHRRPELDAIELERQIRE
ncbi:hypothetical protein PR202_ga28192 [Eleusine coracana subsp. coracana]|uniref:F-box protein n=1 Tax=Eleusine coracana subsp. coracana TaxID=191504 RepID=A0AAV5DHY7_ELECO|nr:hypothetical protein PR202_ga28192 [Eleusine coracana subsp. coracana]